MKLVFPTGPDMPPHRQASMQAAAPGEAGTRLSLLPSADNQGAGVVIPTPVTLRSQSSLCRVQHLLHLPPGVGLSVGSLPSSEKQSAPGPGSRW